MTKKHGWRKEDSKGVTPDKVEGVRENKFADSICRELIFLYNEYRKIKTTLIPKEQTQYFLLSPDMKKELIKAKIEALNKIILHLP